MYKNVLISSSEAMSKLIANKLQLDSYTHFDYYDPNKKQIANSKLIVDCPHITSSISVAYMNFLSMYATIDHPQQNNLLVFVPFDSLI